MDVDPTVETNSDSSGKVKSNKRKLDEHHVLTPELKNIYRVNDHSVPLPNEESDLVVYMKRNGSGTGLAEIRKVEHKKKTDPLYENMSGSTANISTIPSGKQLNRCLEELHLVDRAFCIGNTVARFQNAHLGAEKEWERWDKEDSQIGQVIALKQFADVLVLPSKNVVVENVPLEGSQLVDVLRARAEHNYILYKKWVGDVKGSVVEITVRYDESHTATVMVDGKDANSLLLIREDKRDVGKAFVKGEHVSMLVEDALGHHCSWGIVGVPQALLEKVPDPAKKSVKFTVEKVETVSLMVKWLTCPGARKSDVPPDSNIDKDDISKVVWATMCPNPEFDLLERRFMKTPDGSKVVSRKEYFAHLTQDYGNKFDKTECYTANDRATNSGERSATVPEIVGVRAKVQKLNADRESSSDSDSDSEIAVGGKSNQRAKVQKLNVDRESSSDSDADIEMAVGSTWREKAQKLNADRKSSSDSESDFEVAGGGKAIRKENVEKLNIDSKSSSDSDSHISVETNIPQQNPVNMEDEESDEDSGMDTTSDGGSAETADDTRTRRCYSEKALAEANHSAKALLGEEFTGEVLRTHSLLDVEWMDGTVSRDVPSHLLYHCEPDPGQQHLLPDTVVCLKTAPNGDSFDHFGVILSTNASDCCCTVRWFDRELKEHDNSKEENYIQREDEILSNFEITPQYSRIPLGRYGVPESVRLGTVDLRDVVLQAVGNLKNGKQKFLRSDGTFVEMWRVNVYMLHELMDYGLMYHDAESSTENAVAVEEHLPDFLDLLMPVNNYAEHERDYYEDRDNLQERKAELLLRLMTAPVPDGLVINRMRWLEAVFMLVRSHRTPTRAMLKKSYWESGLLRDALDMAGFLNDYRYEAERGDSISDWIGRKLRKAGYDEKRSVVKYCYKLHVLTRKYPTWFDDMKDDMWKKYYFAMWHYLDTTLSETSRKIELFGLRMNVTMNKVELALGDNIADYYSEAAWKRMTVTNVLEMCDRAVDVSQPRLGVDLGRDMSLLIGHSHTTQICANRLFRPLVDRLLNTRLLNRSYSDMLVQKSVNSWEDVYSDETKHRLDECLGDAPHTLRLKICGDSAVTMSDSFIWYHVMEQVVKPTDGALPTTIYIDPSMSLASFEDGINRWSIMRWIVLMQCGVLSAPFYQVYPKNQEEDNYDVIEEAISANPQLADYRLQLAAIYDYARSVDLTPVCDRLNVIERLFPFKDILATIRNTLSGTTVELPAAIVDQDTLKEFTSGKRSATVQQMRELKVWAGEDPTIPEKEPVVAEESDQDEKRFRMCAECPLSHKFVNSVMRETGLGRSFYTAVRNEHRLLMKHTPEGIHVRAFENRSDLLSFLIIGPSGTPFEGVPFYFDVRLSDSYPERPPEVHYVAFSAEQLNPNLYQSGKVCTSLLGTWQGEGVETWDSKKSNLLQVILSIQALILVRDPYFNEAGYESRREIPDDLAKSKRYNELVAINALEYMWKVIQHPPAPFEKTIQHHVVTNWPSLHEKLLLWSKEETSPPDYPVLGSKGFRMALQKAVSRIDDSVKEKYDARNEADSSDVAVAAPTQLQDGGVGGTSKTEEEVWPPIQASGGERVSGVLDLLTDDNEVPYRRCFAFTEPVTCFMLRRE